MDLVAGEMLSLSFGLFECGLEAISRAAFGGVEPFVYHRFRMFRYFSIIGSGIQSIKLRCSPKRKAIQPTIVKGT